MKKRLLLILALGVSISPAVFADGFTVSSTGQLPMTKTDMRGARCEGQKLLDEMDQSIRQDAAPTSGSASTSH